MTVQCPCIVQSDVNKIESGLCWDLISVFPAPEQSVIYSISVSISLLAEEDWSGLVDSIHREETIKNCTEQVILLLLVLSLYWTSSSQLSGEGLFFGRWQFALHVRGNASD